MGGDAERDLAGLDVGGNGRVGLCGDDVADAIGQFRFPHAEKAQLTRVEAHAAATLQVGQHVVGEHGVQLARRAGQQDGRLAAGFHDAAGRRAVRVGEDDAAAREARLLEVVGRHLAADGGKIGAQAFLLLRHGIERDVQRGSHGFLGQVVVSGSETAGEQHHVRARKRLAHGPGQAGGVVAHGDLIERLISERRQMPGDKLCVGVDNLPHEQLRADGYDLCDHARCTTFRFL